MASIFKNPTHVAQIGYNGFNMNQTADFTCAPCQLLPVYYDILNPGDKFRGTARVKLRTQPLESAAEFSANVRCDWFAVPIEQLFKYFGDQYYGIQDITSNMYQVGRSYNFQASSNMPYFVLSSLGTAIQGAYSAAAAGANLLYPFRHYELSSLNQMSLVNQKLCFLADELRLLDFLGYPIAIQDTLSINMSSFPVTALAYQKIYYDYYRDTERQSNDPAAYNVDQQLDNVNRVIPASTCLNDIFRLHYIPWKKDFFKNVFESPLQGSQSIGSLGTDLGLVNQWLSGLSSVTPAEPAANSFLPNGGRVDISNISPTTVKISGSAGSGNASNTTVNTALATFNPANIKTLFAVQKALEITRRSGKHYDMQTLAHWGVSVPEGISGEVIYLGSQTQPLIVGDVVSTAESGTQPLGTIAGKGYSGVNIEGSYNPQISFEAKSHCVIMCIFCVQPDLRYSQEGLDKLNMLVSPADWLHPEYDNLGMQPMFRYQFFLQNGDYADVYKWQYSYSELKCKYNRVLGNVSRYGALYSWVPQVAYGIGQQSTIYSTSGILYDFLGNPGWLNDTLSYKYLYELLMDPASPTAWFTNYYELLYVRDPFIVSANFDCSKASKMSKYGLMEL